MTTLEIIAPYVKKPSASPDSGRRVGFMPVGCHCPSPGPFGASEGGWQPSSLKQGQVTTQAYVFFFLISLTAWSFRVLTCAEGLKTVNSSTRPLECAAVGKSSL